MGSAAVVEPITPDFTEDVMGKNWTRAPKFSDCSSIDELFDTVEWSRCTADIKKADGTSIFFQEGVEFPSFWSQKAVNVVAQKYFRGSLNSPDREGSLKSVISRIVNTITGWGEGQGYFSDSREAESFRVDLAYLMLHQRMAFNSPVWFNVGYEEHPQCSACFIQPVEDSMLGIMGLAASESIVFKHGSGSGTNLSSLRSSKEELSGGGIASGPVSFMRGYDSFAGVIKSGGKTRRAAKIAILNIDHPDVVEFIECKAKEERKAKALVEAGWTHDFDDAEGAYASLQYQNANHSVRVSDAFMQAVEKGGKFSTKAILSGKVVETHSAKDVWDKIVDAAWECGDPGIQFDDTINKYHTCKESGKINASNPCSEYMFLDDSSCNLATLNLMAFYNDGTFDIAGFEAAVELVILAQDILVDNAHYPLDSIAKVTKEFRSLGINYTNLASLLMSDGAPYDSDRGRRLAAAITAFMTAVAYRKSAYIADTMGTFEGYKQNAFSMKSVIYMHRDSAQSVFTTEEPLGLPILKTWNDVATLAEKYGFRNAQVSLLAPTGTVSFALDADSTGIEPFIVLSGGNKKLVGGGDLDVSAGSTVRRSLLNLGYSEDETENILDFIEKKHTIIGCPGVRESHYPIFTTALSVSSDKRAVVAPVSHVDMMAAVQPFLSGAISKTVNLPHNATKSEIGDLLLRAWKAGIKSLALYRDGSKASQPLNVTASDEKPQSSKVRLSRKHLPKVRASIVHAFSVGGCEGYLKLGFYPDTLKIGEVWIHMAKEGSTLRGMFDSFATAVSVALQFGVPISKFVDKFSHTSFEPSGFTGEETVKQASSIIDYIFRWIEANFPEGMTTPENFLKLLMNTDIQMAATKAKPVEQQRPTFDAPICRKCGHLMFRVGSCHTCSHCSESDGCSA